MNGGVLVFSLCPHFVQHIANAWTEDCTDGTKLHIHYVGYPEMPDFMSWSGPGKLYEHIDPNNQPPSRLMHAMFSLQTIRKPIIGPELPSGTNISNTLTGPHHAMAGSFFNCDRAIVMGINNVPKGCIPWPQNRMGLPPSVEFADSGATRVVSSRVMEFPKINPLFCGKESRYVYGASSLHQFKNRPQQAIGVYDCITGQCKIWTRGWRYYVGEPEMIPSLPEHRRDHVPLELDGMVLLV